VPTGLTGSWPFLCQICGYLVPRARRAYNWAKEGVSIGWDRRTKVRLSSPSHITWEKATAFFLYEPRDLL
jgi:hypothetical protein